MERMIKDIQIIAADKDGVTKAIKEAFSCYNHIGAPIDDDWDYIVIRTDATPSLSDLFLCKVVRANKTLLEESDDEPEPT